MVKVNFIRDTETISVDMPVGRTIMEAAKELGLPEIPADCGGCCACGDAEGTGFSNRNSIGNGTGNGKAHGGGNGNGGNGGTHQYTKCCGGGS